MQVATIIAAEVQIRECVEPDGLYRWYSGEQAPQPVYIALDVRSGYLWADWDVEIGTGVPAEVVYGFERRYGIPLLTGTAANELMAEIAPLAQRVLDGAGSDWDGHNTVAVLDADATAADEEIAAQLAAVDADPAYNPGVLPVWDVTTIGEVWTAEEAGITSTTTDSELAVIEQRLLAEFRTGVEEPHAVIDGLGAYLTGLRDELVADTADED